MPEKNRAVFHWSSGKDSAMALHALLQNEAFQVDYLLTTANEEFERVTMHGTPIPLVRAQAQNIGIPLHLVQLPANPSMEVYNQMMHEKLMMLSRSNCTHAAFGDIFLEDLRAYRDKEIAKAKMTSVYPIWQKDTHTLIKDFIDQGFKAVVVSANELLGADFLGAEIDAHFLRHLPHDIDPCGENGEFHTFCYDGPIFKNEVAFQKGEKAAKAYPNPSGEGCVKFWFMDLIPTT
ncbi:MAG: diphthine--ammonia ligase [Ekhidna sp.]